MPAIQLDQIKKEKELELLEAKVAFLVFETKDGLYGVSSDINIPITTERSATSAEIKAALHAALDTMNNQEVSLLTAQQVMNMQMQIGQKMAEAQMNQAALSKLDLGKR